MKQRFCVSRCCCGEDCERFNWTVRTECQAAEFQFGPAGLEFASNQFFSASPLNSNYRRITGRSNVFSDGMTPQQVFAIVEADGLSDHLFFGPFESLYSNVNVGGLPDNSRTSLGPSSVSYDLNQFGSSLRGSVRPLTDGGANARGDFRISFEVVFTDRLQRVVAGFVPLSANVPASLLDFSATAFSGNSGTGTRYTVVSPLDQLGTRVQEEIAGSAANPYPQLTVEFTGSESVTTRIDSTGLGVIQETTVEVSGTINGENVIDFSHTINTASLPNRCSSGPQIISRVAPVGLSGESFTNGLQGGYDGSLSGSLQFGEEESRVISQRYFDLVHGGSSTDDRRNVGRVYIDESTQIGTVTAANPSVSLGIITQGFIVYSVDVSSGSPVVSAHFETGDERMEVSNLLLGQENQIEFSSGNNFGIFVDIEGPFFDCQPRLVGSLR